MATADLSARRGEREVIMIKQFYIKQHRKLWFNIAREILTNKKVANINILKYYYEPDIYNNCWLCEYVNVYHMGNCLWCPLNTSKSSNTCLDGLYTKVVRAYDYKTQYILSIKIALLPVVR